MFDLFLAMRRNELRLYGSGCFLHRTIIQAPSAAVAANAVGFVVGAATGYKLVHQHNANNQPEETTQDPTACFVFGTNNRCFFNQLIHGFFRSQKGLYVEVAFVVLQLGMFDEQFGHVHIGMGFGKEGVRLAHGKSANENPNRNEQRVNAEPLFVVRLLVGLQSLGGLVDNAERARRFAQFALDAFRRRDAHVVFRKTRGPTQQNAVGTQEAAIRTGHVEVLDILGVFSSLNYKYVHYKWKTNQFVHILFYGK